MQKKGSEAGYLIGIVSIVAAVAVIGMITTIDFSGMTYTGISSITGNAIYNEGEGTLTIELTEGRNLISSFIVPENPNIVAIFSDLVGEGKLVDVKDGDGNFYYPEFDFNGIGNWNIAEAYMVQVTEDATLVIRGTERASTRIDLDVSWSYMGYPLEQPMDAVEAMAPLVEAGKLEQVKDGHGNFYHPEYGFNGIGDLEPGEGYHIKMSEAGVIDFSGEYVEEEEGEDERQPPPPSHKDMELYSERNAFIIPDEDWRSVLQLVPVTTWTDEEGNIVKYPTLIYHQQDVLIRRYHFSIPPIAGFQSFDDSIWQEFTVDEETDIGLLCIPSYDADVEFVISLYEGEQLLFSKTSQDLIIKESVFCDFDLSITLHPETVYKLEVSDMSDGFRIGLFPAQVLEGRQEDFDMGATNLDNDLYFSFTIGYLQISERKGFDYESAVHFLRMYVPDIATLVGETYEEFDVRLVADGNLGANLDEEQLEEVEPEQLIDYWDEYNAVVYAEDDYTKALMASVYASLINAPLAIGDRTVPFEGKHVVIVGSLDCPDSARHCEAYTLRELQEEYVRATNTTKVLMVNPLDIDGVNMEIEDMPYCYDNFHRPCYFPPIPMSIFGKNSLPAPFLAAGKHELMIFNDVSISPDNPAPERNEEIEQNIETTDTFVKDMIETFFDDDAEYLTIVASPKAIPDSAFDENRGGNQKRTIFDKLYALKPFHPTSRTYKKFPEWYLQVGRIYGVTSTDVSSYIARSLFYEELMGSLYERDEYTSFHIGRECDGDDPAEIALTLRNDYRDFGYSSTCSAHVNIGCEHTGTELSDEALEMLGNAQFVTFDDHGLPHRWSAGIGHMTVDVETLPYLKLPVAVAMACLTNNFWQGKEAALGHNFLRQGAIAYYGAAGVAFGIEWEHPHEYLVEAFSLPGEQYETLGSITQLFDIRTDNYLLLGDPTIRIKKRSSQNNRARAECNDGIDNDDDGNVDYFQECRCQSPFHPEERAEPQCNDGIDNDGNGRVDLDDYGCRHRCDNSE